MNITSKFGFTLPSKAINTTHTSVMARQIETLKSIVQRAKIGQTAVIAPIVTIKLAQLYKQ